MTREISFTTKLITKIKCTLLVFVVGGIILNTTEAISSDDFYLFSLQDAEALRYQDETEWAIKPIRTRSLSIGPHIEVRKPRLSKKEKQTISTESPLNLLVFFEKNLASVDMDSLQVVAHKGFFKKDLTKKIKPFIKGLGIDAPKINIPPGKFKIMIKIADNNGHSTKEEYRLIIND